MCSDKLKQGDQDARRHVQSFLGLRDSHNAAQAFENNPDTLVPNNWDHLTDTEFIRRLVIEFGSSEGALPTALEDRFLQITNHMPVFSAISDPNQLMSISPLVQRVYPSQTPEFIASRTRAGYSDTFVSRHLVIELLQQIATAATNEHDEFQDLLISATASQLDDILFQDRSAENRPFIRSVSPTLKALATPGVEIDLDLTVSHLLSILQYLDIQTLEYDEDLISENRQLFDEIYLEGSMMQRLATFIQAQGDARSTQMLQDIQGRMEEFASMAPHLSGLENSLSSTDSDEDWEKILKSNIAILSRSNEISRVLEDTLDEHLRRLGDMDHDEGSPLFAISSALSAWFEHHRQYLMKAIQFKEECANDSESSKQGMLFLIRTMGIWAESASEL